MGSYHNKSIDYRCYVNLSLEIKEDNLNLAILKLSLFLYAQLLGTII